MSTKVWVASAAARAGGTEKNAAPRRSRGPPPQQRSPGPGGAPRRSSGEEDDDEAEDEEEAEALSLLRSGEDEVSNLRLREKLETLWTAKRQMATRAPCDCDEGNKNDSCGILVTDDRQDSRVYIYRSKANKSRLAGGGPRHLLTLTQVQPNTKHDDNTNQDPPPFTAPPLSLEGGRDEGDALAVDPALSPTRLGLKNTEPSALIAIEVVEGFPPLRNLAGLPVPAL